MLHILFGRLWLYDLDGTGFDMSKTYEFKINVDMIMLKSAKPKSSKGHQKT